MGRSWYNPNVTGPIIAVSDFNASTVSCFNEEGVQTAQITSSSGLSNPQGLAFHRGTLYVANTGASNVLEFTGCAPTVVKTLADAGEYPVDVAVASAGQVYVSNIFSTSGPTNGPGNICPYVGTTRQPCFNAGPSSGEYENFFITFDDSNNLWSTWEYYKGIGFVQCYPTLPTGGPGIRATGISMSFPGGLNVEINGSLVVLDQNVGITTWTGGTCSGGTWTQSGSTISSSGAVWVDIALDHKNLEVNRTDSTNLNVNSITYPGGVADDKFLPSGVSLPIGVANSGDAHD
jgi:hypothetical protein